MSETRAGFALRGRNPDVLTCIANLSNDEVFTPPEFANRMLDTARRGVGRGNDGANIWADPTVTFLDPFTKSGVFLREITEPPGRRALKDEIPDLEERVDHILTKQVFGIGITNLTSLLARRSLYCSKMPRASPHSIATSFDDARTATSGSSGSSTPGSGARVGADRRRGRQPGQEVHQRQVQVLRREPEDLDRGEASRPTPTPSSTPTTSRLGSPSCSETTCSST